MHYREQVSQFKLEQSDRLKDLDVMTKKVADAIITQEDVFLAAHRCAAFFDANFA